MTEKQLKSLEKKFGIRLPAEYRSLLLQPPELLLAVLAWDDQDNHESQTPLFRTSKLIAGINEEVRDPESEDFIFDDNNHRRKWPDKFFIIGGTAGGDYYCIKPQLKKTEVFLWHHDSTEFEKCAASIADFVKHIFAGYGERATWDL